MLRLLIPVLIVVNLILLSRSLGWLPGVIGDTPDPGRLARQVNPERIKILPARPTQGRG